MSRKRPQPAAVLFDLDGTLLDTAPDFRAVLHAMCLRHGIAPPDDAAIHATVSSGARALVQLAFDLTESQPAFAALLDDLLGRYAIQIKHSAAILYPGMTGLLAGLQAKNIPWGVVTNKPLRFSEPLLAALDLSARCAVLICPDHVRQSKPSPEPLLLACSKLDCNPGQSIYIGDHPRDIDAGRAAGMTTIAAAYGYLPNHPPVQDWQADFIADQVNDIADYLRLETFV
jgi:2-phosphoglycolate phosphatase